MQTKCPCGAFTYGYPKAGCWSNQTCTLTPANIITPPAAFTLFIDDGFCYSCGAKLNEDGTCEPWQPAIERMVHEATSQVPTCGMTEFALKCYNEIEANRKTAGLTQCELISRAAFRTSFKTYDAWFLVAPMSLTLDYIFTLLNASRELKQKAEATKNG